MIMNYGEAKRRTLQLVFSESLGGAEIPMTYNNQADYVKAIPGLINDCQVYLATTVKKIPETCALSSLEQKDMGVATLYTLPEDCWRMMNGGPMWLREEGGDLHYERFHGYKMMNGDRQLLIPKNTPRQDEMLVEYYRYPRQLPQFPSDDTELDNTLDAQTVIPYYAAAQLVMYDDAFRYSALWNGFETRLGRLSAPVTTEYAPLEDAYGGFYIPGV